MRGASAGLCILLLAFAAPVRAEDPSPADALFPPTDLHGSYDEATKQVVLAWTAPDNGSYTYHVYRDSKEIGETATTTYTGTYARNPLTGLGAVYTVRASPEGTTMQSAPSEPFLLGNSVQSSVVDDTLESIDEMVEPGQFVHIHIYAQGEWCDPVNIGFPNPNVDVNCILDMLHP